MVARLRQAPADCPLTRAQVDGVRPEENVSAHGQRRGKRLTTDHWLRDCRLLRRLVRLRESLMRYKPKSIAALQLALGGLPDRMRVEVDSDIKISAKTVGELRKVSVWSENLGITTPQERYSESVVCATRNSPKS